MPGKLLMTHLIKFLTNCREGDAILDHADIQESIVNSDTIVEIESQLSKYIPEEYNQKLEILQIIKNYYKLTEPELKPIITKMRKIKTKKKIDKLFSESKDVDLNQGLLKVDSKSEMSLIDNTSSRNNSVIELGDITSDSYNISNISLIDEVEDGNESYRSVHSEHSKGSQTSEFSEINNSHGDGTMDNSSNGFNQGTVSSLSLRSKSDIKILNGSIEEQHQASNKLRHKTSGLLNLTIQLFESSNKNKDKSKNENKNNSKITNVRSHSNINNFQEFDESFEEAANVSERDKETTTSTTISGDIIPDVVKQDELILIAAVSSSITRYKEILFEYKDIEEYKEFFGSRIEGTGYLIIDKKRNLQISNHNEHSDKDNDRDNEIRIHTYYIPTCDKTVISDKYLNVIRSLNKLKVVNDSNYIPARNIKIPLTSSR
ncbi:unnamed protein product [[Candida] boidinii]|nr:unnamed protein product [[Candida] boidinii]